MDSSLNYPENWIDAFFVDYPLVVSRIYAYCHAFLILSLLFLLDFAELLLPLYFCILFYFFFSNMACVGFFCYVTLFCFSSPILIEFSIQFM